MKFLTTSLALAAVLLLATSGLALERTPMQMMDDSRGNDWNAATTVTVAYYNFCQGWIWVWGGWSAGDQIGVAFDNCANGTLLQSWAYIYTNSPSGYGFTGTVTLEGADANLCPTGPIAAPQPWLPISGWNGFFWNVPAPNQFIILHTWQAPTGFTAVSAIPTDFAAAGPTGIQACGTCYPSNRVVRSFYYGTGSSPLCPGSTFNDGVCDVELLIDVALSCTISVEESTWGQIKSLYQ